MSCKRCGGDCAGANPPVNDCPMGNMHTFDWEGIHDGHGIVGAGFTCPHCDKFNSFVMTSGDPQECKHCGKESMPTSAGEGY